MGELNCMLVGYFSIEFVLFLIWNWNWNFLDIPDDVLVEGRYLAIALSMGRDDGYRFFFLFTELAWLCCRRLDDGNAMPCSKRDGVICLVDAFRSKSVSDPSLSYSLSSAKGSSSECESPSPIRNVNPFTDCGREWDDDANGFDTGGVVPKLEEVLERGGVSTKGKASWLLLLSSFAPELLVTTTTWSGTIEALLLVVELLLPASERAVYPRRPLEFPFIFLSKCQSRIEGSMLFVNSTRESRKRLKVVKQMKE